jgi:hypothetical protein
MSAEKIETVRKFYERIYEASRKAREKKTGNGAQKPILKIGEKINRREK